MLLQSRRFCLQSTHNNVKKNNIFMRISTSTICFIAFGFLSLFCRNALSSSLDFSGSFGVEDSNYMGLLSYGQNSTIEAVSGEMKIDWSPGRFENKLNLGGLYSLNKKNYYYVMVPEAYTGVFLYKPSGKKDESERKKGAAMFLGRKKEPWSAIDEYWNLGIWQPRFRWNYLHPREQGLTGWFFRFKGDVAEVLAYASPVSIPETGAPYELNNGTFTSMSPWFHEPGSTILLFNRQTRINYIVDMPPLSELALKPGGGIRTAVGKEDGLWAASGYSYKPMNHVSLGYEGYLNIDTLETDVRIVPHVGYHHLISVEGGYREKMVQSWISLLGEKPIPYYMDPALSGVHFTPSLAVSTAVDFAFWGTVQTGTRMGFGYLRKWGGDEKSVGPSTDQVSGLSEPRYISQDILSVKAGTPLPWSWGRKVQIQSKLLYDAGTDGGALLSELQFSPTPSWLISVGADFLGSNSDPKSDNFFSKYRANDLFYGGVSYVF